MSANAATDATKSESKTYCALRPITFSAGRFPVAQSSSGLFTLLTVIKCLIQRANGDCDSLAIGFAGVTKRRRSAATHHWPTARFSPHTPKLRGPSKYFSGALGLSTSKRSRCGTRVWGNTNLSRSRARLKKPPISPKISCANLWQMRKLPAPRYIRHKALSAHPHGGWRRRK